MNISKLWINLICVAIIITLMTVFGVRLIRYGEFDLPVFLAFLFSIISYCVLIFQKNRLRIVQSTVRDLPAEKLMLEVDQLSRLPINSVLSVVISLSTALVLFFTGAFDLKEKTLKYETSKLAFEKLELTTEKAKIQLQIDSAKKTRDSVFNEYIRAAKETARLRSVVDSLENQKDYGKKRIIELEKERFIIYDAMDSLKKELSNRQYPYYSKTPDDIRRMYINTLNEHQEKISELNRKLALCQDSISRKISRF
jgi:hypothetical protein